MLAVTPVTTPQQLEELRLIRNSCRSFFTGSRSYITKERQLSWWRSKPKEFQVFLYCLATGEAVGFGALRPISGKLYFTMGVYPKYRGFGLGQKILKHLIDLSPEELWLDVLESNTFAIRLYSKNGFKETSRSKGVITMVRNDSTLQSYD